MKSCGQNDQLRLFQELVNSGTSSVTGLHLNDEKKLFSHFRYSGIYRHADSFGFVNLLRRMPLSQYKECDQNLICGAFSIKR